MSFDCGHRCCDHRANEWSSAIPERAQRRLRELAEGLDAGPCWLWPRATIKSGYGRFQWLVDGKQTGMVAHRAAYLTFVGSVPDGWHLHHECHTRLCWNPAHLRPMPAGEHATLHHLNGTTCRKGLHPWPESARADFAGVLHCHDCYQASQKRARARYKAEGRFRKPPGSKRRTLRAKSPGVRLHGRSDHGTRTCYVAGCRCDDCRDASSDYAQARRARLAT